MITIRIKATGVIKEVDRNTAFDLIDKGEAERYDHNPAEKQFNYSKKVVQPKETVTK